MEELRDLEVIKAPFSYFVEKLKERNKKKLNNVVVFIGRPGSGKSYSAIMLGKMIDPTLSVDRICFGVEEFLDKLSELKGKSEGKVIILDEGGVTINSREFQKVTNKAISYVAQTFRFTRINLFICVPSFYFIDKSVRILTNFLVRMKEPGRAWIYELDFDDITGRRIIRSIEEIKIPNPAKHYPKLISEYEKKKREFFYNLIQKEKEKVKMDQSEIRKQIKEVLREMLLKEE